MLGFTVVFTVSFNRYKIKINFYLKLLIVRPVNYTEFEIHFSTDIQFESFSSIKRFKNESIAQTSSD